MSIHGISKMVYIPLAFVTPDCTPGTHGRRAGIIFFVVLVFVHTLTLYELLCVYVWNANTNAANVSFYQVANLTNSFWSMKQWWQIILMWCKKYVYTNTDVSKTSKHFDPRRRQRLIGNEWDGCQTLRIRSLWDLCSALAIKNATNWV